MSAISEHASLPGSFCSGILLINLPRIAVMEKFAAIICAVKLYHILNERFGPIAVRLPSLSRGNGLGLWHNF